MNKTLRSWIGQVTTGGGFMILVPTILSVFSGALTWTAAVPLLVGGIVGLLWPENTALKSAAQTIAADVTTLVEAVQIKGSVTTSGPTPAA